MVLEEKSQLLNRGKSEHIQELQVEIGKALSEQRVRKGLSIQQMESITKISQSFIEDIEQGRFDRLPGKIFGRGFIKNICSLLELDHAPILEKYERSWVCIPEIKESKSSRPFSFFPRENGILSSPHSPLRNLLSNRSVLKFAIPVLLILIVAIIRFAVKKEPVEISKAPTPSLAVAATPQQDLPQTAPQTSPTSSTAVPVAGPVAANVQASSTVIAQEPPKSQPAAELKTSPVTKDLPTKIAAEARKQDAQKNAETGAHPDGKPVLILNVKSEVKIKHRVLPDDYSVTTFTPGVYRFPFDDRVDIFLFDASAVEITYNNKNLGTLGKKGEERKLSFYATELTPDLDKKPM